MPKAIKDKKRLKDSDYISEEKRLRLHLDTDKVDRTDYLEEITNDPEYQAKQLKKDIETYQNDRTTGIPNLIPKGVQRASGMNMGGEVRGGGSAIRGKGFKGVF